MILSVCGSVYLSASISPELRIKSPPFLRLLKLAVTWSSWQACDTLCTCVYGWRHVWTQWQECTHTGLIALFPGLPGWAGTRKVKPIWILLKQEIVSGSGISWAICKSASRSRQITTPAPHHSSSLQSGALPAAQPTASRHWRHYWQEYTALDAYTQSDTAGGITDLTLRHVLKLTHHGAAPVWVGVLWYLQLPCYSCELMSVGVHCICSIGGVPSCTEVLPCVQIFWRCPGVYACFHFNTTVKCHIVL